MRRLCIANPASSRGKTGLFFPDLKRVICHRLGEVHFIETENPSHAANIAYEVAYQNWDQILVIGGDGTLNEVVSGLMTALEKEPDHEVGRTRALTQLPSIGIIAQGTGSDFRRSLKFEHRLGSYLDAIENNETELVDVGYLSFENRNKQLERRHFINVTSLGMGGLVAEYIKRSPSVFGGKLAYFFSSLKALRNVEAAHLAIRYVDERGDFRQLEAESYMIALCNGSYFGAGMCVAPNAKLNDGFFDVIILAAGPKIKFMMRSLHIYRGRHLDKPGTLSFKTSRIEISRIQAKGLCQAPLYLEIDGEALGEAPIVAEIKPRQLRVCCTKSARTDT